jgi:hypothetical protein
MQVANDTLCKGGTNFEVDAAEFDRDETKLKKPNEYCIAT